MTRKLPVGIQSFEDLRSNGYLYVDKTAYVQQLVDTGKVYFLSRPRRFGKSLLVSTMEAYFEGKKELFHGLSIEGYEEAKGNTAWTEYPVIPFYLSGGDYNSEHGLASILDGVLRSAWERYGLPDDYKSSGDTLPLRFKVILEKLYRFTGKQVVVLVDEYDKPLLSAADNPQEERNREIYKGFFSVLKDQDRYVKFAFFTGVTKFSKVSIFSDLNQLKDISLLNLYAGICGITGEELKDNFAPEITALAGEQGLTDQECLDKLAQTYDGYHFSENSDGVYNPFSLLNAFFDRKFDSYWFETGTPTFLIRKLQKSSFRVEQFAEGVTATEDELKDYRTENPNPIPLFYQSGYLTISGYDKRFRAYDLRFPNEEVRYGFLNSLVPYVFGEKDTENPYSAMAMTRALERGDADGLKDQLFSFFASVPYSEGAAAETAKYEDLWRDRIYILFSLLGQFVTCEVHTAKGRSDCIVQTNDFVWIFEFKVDRSADEALQQIGEKGYADPFKADQREVLKVGVNFSSDSRNIAEWKVE